MRLKRIAIALLCFCVYAPGEAQPAKIPIFLPANDSLQDERGRLLAYAVRERFRASHRFVVVSSGPEARVMVTLTTNTARIQCAARKQELTAVALLMVRPSDLSYLGSSVEFMEDVDEAAAQIVASVDAMLDER